MPQSIKSTIVRISIGIIAAGLSMFPLSTMGAYYTIAPGQTFYNSPDGDRVDFEVDMIRTPPFNETEINGQRWCEYIGYNQDGRPLPRATAWSLCGLGELVGN